MTGEFLKVQQEGPIVTWTMDQPDLRNALSGNSAVEELVVCAENYVTFLA